MLRDVAVLAACFTALLLLGVAIALVGSWLGAQITGRKWLVPWQPTDTLGAKIISIAKLLIPLNL